MLLVSLVCYEVKRRSDWDRIRVGLDHGLGDEDPIPLATTFEPDSKVYIICMGCYDGGPLEKHFALMMCSVCNEKHVLAYETLDDALDAVNQMPLAWQPLAMIQNSPVKDLCFHTVRMQYAGRPAVRCITK